MTVSSIVILSLGFSGQAFGASSSYKVKAGDTLWGIAQKNHVTVAQLKKWNKLSTDLIKRNQVIRLSQPATTVKAASTAKKAAVSAKKASYKSMTFKATAYTASCKGCSGITATGINLKKNPNAKVISVDPRVIPLGTKVYVEGYGYAIAADRGHAMQGNKIDVFFSSKSKAYSWGVKTVKVRIYR